MRLQGSRLTLVPFGPESITPRYLAWLVDPVVNRYSQRLGQPAQTADDARRWLAGLAPSEVVLAMLAPGLGHIGNVKFGPIDTANSRADIAILIGEQASWGMGFGGEAVYLVMQHIFDDLGLNRVDAGSANPAFIAMVHRLGWMTEGVQRERVRIGGQLVDWTLLSLLRREFVRNERFEPAARAGSA